MARRKKRARRFNPAPLLFVALCLSVLVACAIFPRHRAKAPPRAHSHSAATAPSPLATPEQSPAPSATQTPQASPSAGPQATENANGPQVAIIIDDCGQWPVTEHGYLALPIPITLAVLPDVRYTAQIAHDAGAAGKSVMLHLPMEPLSHVYPGPGEIKTAMSDADIIKQTQADLAQVPLAKGVNNHEGSEASADARVMNDVIGVIKAHGLFFIDSRTNPQTAGARVAQAAGVPQASRDVFLDNEASVAYTESMLERAAAIAERNGSAIAIGHPKATTLEALQLMYPKMRAQGIRFAFVSALVR